MSHLTIENMKAYLIAKWPGTAWAKKVMEMPDSQVVAIYFRLINAVANNHVVHLNPSVTVANVYTCLDCGKTYVADNPELSECRFCGSMHIIHEERKVYIRKDNDDDD